MDIITDAHVSEPHDLFYDNLNQPRMFSGKALWDTGASHCSITRRVIEELNIGSDSFADIVHTQGEQKRVPTYMVNITLRNKLYIPDLVVNEIQERQRQL